VAGRWQEIGAGVLWALGAALSFTLVFFFNVHWLKALDGRLRTFVMMAVTAALVVSGGVAPAQWRCRGTRPAGWARGADAPIRHRYHLALHRAAAPRRGRRLQHRGAELRAIAVLAIAWVVLGQAIAPLQVLGAFIVVGAIAWLSTRNDDGYVMSARHDKHLELWIE